MMLFKNMSGQTNCGGYDHVDTGERVSAEAAPPLLLAECQFFSDHFGQNASLQKAFSKIIEYFAEVALQSQ